MSLLMASSDDVALLAEVILSLPPSSDGRSTDFNSRGLCALFSCEPILSTRFLRDPYMLHYRPPMDSIPGMERFRCGLDVAKLSWCQSLNHTCMMLISIFILRTVILQMRVWALYDCQRNYLYLVVTAFFCQIIAMSVILGLSAVQIISEFASVRTDVVAFLLTNFSNRRTISRVWCMRACLPPQLLFLLLDSDSSLRVPASFTGRICRLPQSL